MWEERKHNTKVEISVTVNKWAGFGKRQTLEKGDLKRRVGLGGNLTRKKEAKVRVLRRPSGKKGGQSRREGNQRVNKNPC